jgi:NAD(P)-dependent dehydrogenase (short-subunit alcohol dehydrogenase family)
MMLKDKVVVVYSAGGAISGAVAHAFPAEGAYVFLSGRRRAPVEEVAEDIAAVGGSAEVAEINALEGEVDRHLRYLAGHAGRVDISFNAAGIPNAEIVGVPLAELDAEKFSLPIAAYTTSYFLTARLASPARPAARRAPRPQRQATASPSYCVTVAVTTGGVDDLPRSRDAEILRAAKARALREQLLRLVRVTIMGGFGHRHGSSSQRCHAGTQTSQPQRKRHHNLHQSAAA